MRIFSEEKRNNTLEILLTLPYSETQIVLGKFLALFFLLFLSLILTLSLPISLFFLAKIYLPEVLVAYLGCWLLGSAFITLTMFFSVKTKNQVVAFLTSAILIFFLLILGTDFSASFLPRFLQDFLSYFSPFYHFQNFVKGVLDWRSVFYFVSFIFLFLFLTVIDLEKRE
jgi:ABC-2 type transport system permease protein